MADKVNIPIVDSWTIDTRIVSSVHMVTIEGWGRVEPRLITSTHPCATAFNCHRARLDAIKAHVREQMRKEPYWVDKFFLDACRAVTHRRMEVGLAGIDCWDLWEHNRGSRPTDVDSNPEKPV